jgi:hypothetical protein
MLAQVEPNVDDKPLDIVIVGANKTDPRASNDAGSLRCDSMMHGANPSTPGHTAPANVVLVPRCHRSEGSRTTSVRIPGL